VIPARNESGKIGLLLKDIGKQLYPLPWIEVVVVDDDSDDNTNQEATEALDSLSLEGKVIRLEATGHNPSPKKRALSKGIAEATGELIITTDADCRAGEGWIKTLACYYLETDSSFISGPVRQAPLTTLFSKLQALEFLSLVGSGAGAIGAGKALMSNGANLAFRKEDFWKVGGYEGNENFASGDDVFLMMKLQKEIGDHAISFVKSRSAIVDTEAKKSWKEFLRQRTRWASKAKAYRTTFAIYASGVVLAFNALLMLSLPGLFFFPGYAQLVLILWGIKLATDATLLFPFTRFMGQQQLLWYFIPAQVFVAFYTSIAGFLGFSKSFSWKGRTFKK
jgi:cellulose synthase/poly-beta-1,6-N-acetylglucosamine synthase-like glycosyltransferase